MPCCTSGRCSTATRSARRSTRAARAAILPPAFQASGGPTSPTSSRRVTGRADGHRGDVAALVGDPGALPADGGYVVSVVLIEARRPSRRPAGAARGGRTRSPARDRGVVRAPDLLPPVPTIVPRRARPSRSRRHASARRAASTGHHLDGTRVGRRSRTGCSTPRSRSRSARTPTRPGSTSRSRRAPAPRPLAGGHLRCERRARPTGRHVPRETERRRDAARARAGAAPRRR